MWASKMSMPCEQSEARDGFQPFPVAAGVAGCIPKLRVKERDQACRNSSDSRPGPAALLSPTTFGMPPMHPDQPSPFLSPYHSGHTVSP